MKYNVIDMGKLWMKGLFRLILGKNRSEETCLHSNIHYQLKLLVALVTVLMSACSDDWMKDPDGSESAGAERFIVLKIAVPTGETAAHTRANPMGGEDGNGREDGILNENMIHDLNIFFYNHSEGMNAPDATPVKGFYFNLDNPDDEDNSVKFDKVEPSSINGMTYYEVKFIYEGEITNFSHTALKFITVANVGKPMGKSLLTLGDLRKHNGHIESSILSSSWIETSVDGQKVKDYDRFVMTTAYADQNINGKDYGSSTINFSGTGSENAPYLGETTVERLCARIDLWYNKAQNAGNSDSPEELTYSVKGGADDSEIATVHIINVLPVNVMQKPSFLLKKVTDESGTTTRSDWSASGLGGITSFKWGGVEMPHPNAEGKDRPVNYVVEPTTLLKNITDADPAGWYGDTGAETVKNSIMQPDFGKIGNYYNGDPASSSSPNYNCDRIAIIGYANENTHPTDCFKSEFLTGLAFRAIYEPKHVILSYIDNGENPFTYDNSDYSKGKTFFRYSPTNQSQSEGTALYFQNMDALNAYKTRHPGDNAIVTEFTDGICYYNLWLKHYDDVDDGEGKSDPHAALPMEYATVRNNIYRVAISFSGPGDPTPEMREPNNIHSRIFVRPWNQRKENSPIVF